MGRPCGDDPRRFFGDNVDMRSFRYYLREDQDDVVVSIREHAFPVGKSIVHVAERARAHSSF